MSEAEFTTTVDPSITRGKSAQEIHPLARFPEEWAEALGALGEKPYRARQVFRWIHERGVTDPALMTDLSKPLRAELTRMGVGEPGRVSHVHESKDGTRKVLIDFQHGAKIECVIIPMTPLQNDADAAAADDDDEEEPSQKKKVTLCISTQFGCAMGCVFCASGQSGLFRGLGAAEVVYQVLLTKRLLRPDEDLRNLVFMGMGEPLHHYEETERALRLITHPDGIRMSPRRITVSTVGLVPGIRKLGEDFAGKIGLAVSLHAPTDEIRSQIMPMNRRYPIKDLMRSLREYPLPNRKRLTIEYTLIGELNDDVAHADQLARLLESLRVKVNLIPMNPIEKSPLKAPSEARVSAFRERLASHGVSCFVRTRRGDEVAAACGQLAMQAVEPQRLVRRKN